MVAVVALPMDCLKGCAQFLQPSVADVLDEDRRLQLWGRSGFGSAIRDVSQAAKGTGKG